MQEMRLKRLTLFLLESLVMQNGRILNKEFEEQFNDFIYSCYQKNKELLSVIFDPDILEEKIKSKTNILTIAEIIRLVYSYPGIENYVKLLDEIGQETDKKILKLAAMFTQYYNEILNLYYADSNQYYSKGYPRILQ